MHIDNQLILRMLRAGALMCVGPLAFDACASIYAHRIGMYAPPFLYAMFFALGVGLVLENARKETKNGDS